jgi:hypothetical protein
VTPGDEERHYGGAFTLDFYSEVRVVDAPEPSYIGSVGAVLGRSRNDSGDEFYAVSLDGHAETVTLSARDLTPTGRRRSREDYYGGDGR